MARLVPEDTETLLSAQTQTQTQTHDEPDEWQQPPIDLDAFFKSLYAYHEAHGMWGLVLAELHDWILNIGIMGFAFVLVGCVDWSRLLQCDEPSDLGQYLHTSPYWLMIVWSGLLILFVAWRALRLSHTIPTWRESHRFYVKELQITSVHQEWADVVGRMIALQTNRRRILIANQRTLTPIDIASRVLRRENYLIAIVEHDILNCEMNDVTVWFASCIILSILFHPKRPWVFDIQPAHLQFRCTVAITVIALLLPVLLLFRIVYLALRAAERAVSPVRTFAPRRWSTATRWRVREYNEYRHSIRRRLAHAGHHAQPYLDQVPRPWSRRVLSLGSFISGSVVGMITLLAALQEDVLTNLHIFDRNLLWWLALWTCVFAGTRHLKPPDIEYDPTSLRSASERIDAALGIDCTAESPASHAARIERMYPLFIYEWASSLLCILRTPMILWQWRRDAHKIVDDLRAITTFDTRMGDICGASLMSTLPSESALGGKYAHSFHSFDNMYASVWDLQGSIN